MRATLHVTVLDAEVGHQDVKRRTVKWKCVAPIEVSGQPADASLTIRGVAFKRRLSTRAQTGKVEVWTQIASNSVAQSEQ